MSLIERCSCGKPLNDCEQTIAALIREREAWRARAMDSRNSVLREQLRGAVEERDQLRAENERLRGELRSLRAAWDEHMKTCPQHASMRVPSFEEIDAWMKAPSDTASVPELVAMREDES